MNFVLGSRVLFSAPRLLAALPPRVANASSIANGSISLKGQTYFPLRSFFFLQLIILVLYSFLPMFSPSASCGPRAGCPLSQGQTFVFYGDIDPLQPPWAA